MIRNNIYKIICQTILPVIFLFGLSNTILAKNDWSMIGTKDYKIIGNTSEKNLKKVHRNITYLEHVFLRQFDANDFRSIVPTNIIVYKNDESFREFKPIENGQRKDWVAGYFHPGEDLNHVVLAAEGNNLNTTVFHEYTHSLLNNYYGQENVPPWLNEGLAEFYEHLEIRRDKLKIGLSGFSHGKGLKPSQLVPLDDFFQVDYKELREKSEKEIETFYYQSWLIVHYLLNGEDGEHARKFETFLQLILEGESPKTAYANLFEKDLEDLDRKLRNYLDRGRFSAKTIKIEKIDAFKNKLEPRSITEAEALGFQGEMLVNLRFFDEAESYLRRSLEIDSSLSVANASMGILKMNLGDFPAATKFMKVALKNDPDNYLLNYRYAYILTREDVDTMGFIRPFEAEKLAIIHNRLKQTMSLKPNFAEAFYLYAFVNLVQNSDYEDGMRMIKKAIHLSPTNYWYKMRLSELHFRLEEFEMAEKIANIVIAKTNNPVLVDYAHRNLDTIKARREMIEQQKAVAEIAENYVRTTDGILTEQERSVLQKQLVVDALNKMLRKPKVGEKRLVGVISKITCSRNGISYLIQTPEENLKFKAATFDDLRLAIYNMPWNGDEFGCGSSFPDNLVVVTFRAGSGLEVEDKREIVGFEFVPNYFKLSDHDDSKMK